MDDLSGTKEYFDYYKSLIDKIESKRDVYFDSLPGMLIGTAMLKIIFDYYQSLNYSVKDTEASEIDDKYNIDLIALKEDEIVVTQVKSGAMSFAEIRKFCHLAPSYIKENEPKRKRKVLEIMAHKLDEKANQAFIIYGNRLLNEGYILKRIVPEQIINELPKYKIHFKELKKIHK